MLFSTVIILLYTQSNLLFFSFDLPGHTNNILFSSLNADHSVDENVTVCNMGTLESENLKRIIDTILSYQPRMVGINTCELDERYNDTFKEYSNNKKVLIGDCEPHSKSKLGRIIYETNTVTHFTSNDPDIFEIQLTNSWETLEERNNKKERIDFRNPDNHYFQVELRDFSSYSQEIFENRIILIGYIGDHMTREMTYFRSSRITPMNKHTEGQIPDMYDTQISANIISTINEGTFINEVHPVLRIAIIFAFGLANVLLMTYIRTKWRAVNLLIYIILFLVLMALGPILIVLLFDENYYVELNELPVLLTIITIFTIASNSKPAQSSPVT
jgi:CHASE2 domain-containing sensor protein